MIGITVKAPGPSWHTSKSLAPPPSRTQTRIFKSASRYSGHSPSGRRLGLYLTESRSLQRMLPQLCLFSPMQLSSASSHRNAAHCCASEGVHQNPFCSIFPRKGLVPDTCPAIPLPTLVTALAPQAVCLTWTRLKSGHG